MGRGALWSVVVSAIVSQVNGVVECCWCGMIPSGKDEIRVLMMLEVMGSG